MKTLPLAAAALAVLTLAGCGGGGQEKTATAGADAVARCVSCHSFEADGPKRTGPNLAGVFGQPAASKPGYNYSRALKDSGIVWTAENLDSFLEAPQQRVPGNRMSFSGEPDAAKRQAIIAQLQGGAAK